MPNEYCLFDITWYNTCWGTVENDYWLIKNRGGELL